MSFATQKSEKVKLHLHLNFFDSEFLVTCKKPDNFSVMFLQLLRFAVISWFSLSHDILDTAGKLEAFWVFKYESRLMRALKQDCHNHV